MDFSLWHMVSAVAVPPMLEHRLNSWANGLLASWHLRSSQTGTGSSVPALAGEFFTTEPPRKPCLKYFADPISFFNDELYNEPKEGKGEKERGQTK